MTNSLRKELLKAKKHNYAIAAFNWDNLEMLKGIIDGSKKCNAVVIAMITESALKYIGFEYAMNIMKIAKKENPNILFHLDHGFDKSLIKKVIDYNVVDSVMIDASLATFTNNVKYTKEIVDYAHNKLIEVEGEIGHVGGKEDDRNSENKAFTDVFQAVAYASKTNVDALAIAVGTIHGKYKSAINLQFDLISKINDSISIPLVLHGASGVSSKDIKKAIECGITKINFGTDLKIAYSDTVKSFNSYDARKFGQAGIDSVSKIVQEKILMTNSLNSIAKI